MRFVAHLALQNVVQLYEVCVCVCVCACLQLSVASSTYGAVHPLLPPSARGTQVGVKALCYSSRGVGQRSGGSGMEFPVNCMPAAHFRYL